MKRYYIHIQGWAHAMTCYGNNERDARKRFRDQQGFNRLPKGTALWEATD